MKIFLPKPNSVFANKINFVDENNVFLGFDLEQGCCETSGWYISDTVSKHINHNQDIKIDLSGWAFDPNYFSLLKNQAELDEGEIAVFRIVKENEEKFIHLFNGHNGYYSHGFEFIKDEERIQKGNI